MRTPYQSYNAQQWRQIMNHYNRSGLNQKTFCRQEGLAMSTFSKWRKHLGMIKTRPEVDPPADFKPLLPVSPSPVTTTAVASTCDHNDWDMELVLGAGITLRLRTTSVGVG